MRGLFNWVINHIQRQFHSTIENKQTNKLKKQNKKEQNKRMDKEKKLYIEKIIWNKLPTKLF